MKKVLALVLALTMVLGFAATASASYNWNGNTIKIPLLKNDIFGNADIGDLDYTADLAVDGNKEYKFKLVISEDDLNPSFVNYDANYDSLYLDFQVLNIIESYYATRGNRTWTWAQINTSDGSNPMATDILALFNDMDVTTSNLWTAFTTAMQVANATFESAYNSQSVKTAIRDLQRSPYYTNYVNGYYGYDKGIVATATSKDDTYATITSQPTVTVNRAYGQDTTYTVEFKVKFTNTTFRTADVDIELVLNGAGSTQQNYYESKDTYSFTVYQAQYRTFTAQDATIAFETAASISNTLCIGSIQRVLWEYIFAYSLSLQQMLRW